MINDYLVRWSTANHDNVATQITHYKTNSFTIQNQASHVTQFLVTRKEERRELPTPPLISPRHNPKSALAFLWSVRGKLGLIDEHTQSD